LKKAITKTLKKVNMQFTKFATAMLASSAFFGVVANGQRLDCEPCIERSKYRIQAIYHGDKQDPFWKPVEAAAIQAGKVLGVDLEVTLYDDFSPSRMADDIRIAAQSKNPPDALIVTLPSPLVEKAVSEAVKAGIPVFGLNSGYQQAANLGLKAFVAQDEYLAGVAAAKEFLRLTNNSIEKFRPRRPKERIL
jgi:ABC-type sugar transport system substrate-binding protein